MIILLATDGSEYSERAARYLGRLGLGQGHEVFVLHVLKEHLLPDLIDPAHLFKKAGRAGAERLIDNFVGMLGDGEKVVGIMREGEPWREILQASDDFGADLVVMGHKGLSGLDRFLVGSVTSHVLRHGTVSVLMVRDAPQEDRPLRILLCADGSRSAEYGRETLAGLPVSGDTEVHVLCVVDMEVITMPEKYYPDEDISRMMAGLREHSLREAERTVAGEAAKLKGRFWNVSTHVVFGVPENEILREAEALPADLIVMGSKGLHGIKGALLGSVSHRVSRHAHCAVLVAKHPEPFDIT